MIYSPQEEIHIQNVLDAVEHLGETKDYMIKSILAVFVSTFLQGRTSLWLMIVGSPSSNKTTMVDLLKSQKENPDVYKLDTLTSNPFSSGQKEKDKPQDLLPLLDNKCFIIKEYGTIFGRSDEVVKQLISDLVAIYDGEYAKHSPMRGTIRYEVAFSHIGCVTPMALNSRQRYMSAVGARFLYLRIDQQTENERQQNLARIWRNKDQTLTKKQVANLVCAFTRQLKKKVQAGVMINTPAQSQLQLNLLAQLIARARGIVLTDRVEYEDREGNQRSHYEVIDMQIEEPYRSLHQLIALTESLALVNGHQEVGRDEIAIAKRVAMSSMPVRRADALRVFEQKPCYTIKEAAGLLGKNYKTVKRNFDELHALGILQRSKLEHHKAYLYTLQNSFLELFDNDHATSERISVHPKKGLI